MKTIFTPQAYYCTLYIMTGLAVVVFLALQRITAPYGIAYSDKWGVSVNNKAGWVMMEAPAFIAMLLLMICARHISWTTAAIASLFLLHYFYRSFIFPLRMRGKSRMPLAIAAMGALFNIVNAYLIGGWLFFMAPTGYYDYITSPFTPSHALPFTALIVGLGLFLWGMGINRQADGIVRRLRKPGETGHKIPRGGMFRYVTSANYLGEIVEWAGYALITWSAAGAVFLLWTCANLVPRAARLHQRYLKEFGEEYRSLGRKRIFPHIY